MAEESSWGKWVVIGIVVLVGAAIALHVFGIIDLSEALSGVGGGGAGGGGGVSQPAGGGAGGGGFGWGESLAGIIGAILLMFLILALLKRFRPGAFGRLFGGERGEHGTPGAEGGRGPPGGRGGRGPTGREGGEGREGGRGPRGRPGRTVEERRTIIEKEAAEETGVPPIREEDLKKILDAAEQWAGVLKPRMPYSFRTFSEGDPESRHYNQEFRHRWEFYQALGKKFWEEKIGFVIFDWSDLVVADKKIYVNNGFVWNPLNKQYEVFDYLNYKIELSSLITRIGGEEGEAEGNEAEEEE